MSKISICRGYICKKGEEFANRLVCIRGISIIFSTQEDKRMRKKRIPLEDMPEDTMQNRIKKLRAEKLMTQEEFAEALNLMPNTYGKYERGKLEFPVDVLGKIAEYCKVTTDYIILGKKPSVSDEIMEILHGYPKRARAWLADALRKIADALLRADE